MPYGRGGAGNIYAVEQETARVQADLEANNSSSNIKDGQPTDQTRQGEQQYAHSGRGGAGNYYSPQTLTETGSFNNATRSHILGDGTQAPAATANSPDINASSNNTGEQSSSGLSRKVGRGGAGNYAFGVSESEEKAALKRLDEEQRRQQVQADVEKGVEEMLAPPPKARVTGLEFS